MERLKNIYEVSAVLDNGEAKNIMVFSHSHDNAVKKAKVYLLRKEHRDIGEIASTKMIYKDVIY